LTNAFPSTHSGFYSTSYTSQQQHSKETKDSASITPTYGDVTKGGSNPSWKSNPSPPQLHQIAPFVSDICDRPVGFVAGANKDLEWQKVATTNHIT
jgi:hypothetical protein